MLEKIFLIVVSSSNIFIAILIKSVKESNFIKNIFYD
jgi:hypothetical protein